MFKSFIQTFWTIGICIVAFMAVMVGIGTGLVMLFFEVFDMGAGSFPAAILLTIIIMLAFFFTMIEHQPPILKKIARALWLKDIG